MRHQINKTLKNEEKAYLLNGYFVQDKGKYINLLGQAYADNGKMIEGVKRIVQVDADYPVIFEGVNVLD